jgi:DNA-binding XRE family transcriptional regulator
MSATSLLVTDRPAFESRWRAALEQAGLSVDVVEPTRFAGALAHRRAVVLDASCPFFDEDELLAHAGLLRALGRPVAVVLPADESFASAEDLLMDICLGLVVRNEAEVAPAAQVLARRADTRRAERFEYLTVSPRPAELLAILGDGRTVLLKRPLSEADDNSEVAAIELSEQADAATLRLASGQTVAVRASEVGRDGASTTGPVEELSGIDGARLGARLRELRLAAGLTQAELARRTGIHRPNIARVEAGRHTPSLETLSRLANASGVPTSRVLTGA